MTKTAFSNAEQHSCYQFKNCKCILIIKAFSSKFRAIIETILRKQFILKLVTIQDSQNYVVLALIKHFI